MTTVAMRQVPQTEVRSEALRSGKEYLNALNDGRRVFLNGERIDNVATHPLTRGYAETIARWYDAHLDPANRGILTFVDERGIRRPIMWLRQCNKDELLRRRKYHDTIYRMFGRSMFARLPDVNNSVFLTYIDDPTPWEENTTGVSGKGFAENIRQFWATMVEHNLNVAPAVIDPPVDRSRPEAEAESPNCKVVEYRDDGIVISGVKAVATGSAFADWLMVGVFWRPGMPSDQVMYLVVPANAPGVTILSREATSREQLSAEEHPLLSFGDELDNAIILENVFVPRKHIFHLGNPEHAMFYPQRLFDWLHWADLVRFGVKTELLAGLALLIGDGSGLLKIPQTASRIADIIRFRETIRAFIVASDDTGFMTPGGMYKPNNLYADFGRAYYQEHAKNIHNEILDLSGRSAIIQPAASDFEQFGSTLDAMLKGAWTNGRERLKVFRVIRDMFLTDWGGRGRMFDQFNGTPLNTIRMLTMMRTEFHPNGPLAAFAREVCDIPLVEGQSTVQQQIADYAKAQDVATT
jgi:3,5,6-trichloropyridin-2-ol/2,4,6-trichlorophenol monooxygenase